MHNNFKYRELSITTNAVEKAYRKLQQAQVYLSFVAMPYDRDERELYHKANIRITEAYNELKSIMNSISVHND